MANGQSPVNHTGQNTAAALSAGIKPFQCCTSHHTLAIYAKAAVLPPTADGDRLLKFSGDLPLKTLDRKCQGMHRHLQPLRTVGVFVDNRV